MAVAETANLLVNLSLGGNFSKQIAKARGELQKFQGSTGRVGKGIGQLGGGLARVGAVGAVALGGALAYTAKQAIDFEDAFQGVVKTVDEADLKSAGLTFDDLSKSIRKMSTEMPNSAIELAGIAEAAGALGIKAKDIESFTKQVAILASTTNVSADDAATALGQLQNVMSLTGDEFDNFAATLVDLGNKGASTESQILEITRRSGAAAKLIGIAKDKTLGWAAAAANLGLEQEVAGTSLQTFYLRMQSLVGSKGLPKIAKIAGLTAQGFKKAFAKDASGTLEKFLRGLGKLPKDARLKAVEGLFGKRSGLTRLILGLSDSIDKNLAPSLDTSTQAWKDATAAQIEFDKRNKTVRSSISRLHNVLIDAAVSIGEGFAPALGRAADKLANFLKSDENRKQLSDLGKEIGDFIDKIDWDDVAKGGKIILGVFKTAGTAALNLIGIIGKLPKEVLAVGGGAVVLNKISGGLLGAGAGNVLGGLAGALTKSLAASIPIFGRAFVQPVFVTNMGAGLGGGIPGAAAGAAGIGAGALLAGAGGVAGLLAGGQAAADQVNKDKGTTFKMPNGFLDIPGQLGNLVEAVRVLQEGPKVTTRGFNRIEAAERASAGQTDRGFNRIEAGEQRTAGAVRASGSATAGAVRANRPIVTTNVKVAVSGNSVNKVIQVTGRYGQPTGSRNQNNIGVSGAR